MVGSQRLLAVAMALVLAGGNGSVKPEVIGIVVGANGVSVGTVRMTEGASVYAGDQIATEAGGSLGLRSGGTVLWLAGESVMRVRGQTAVDEHAVGKFSAELLRGEIALSKGAHAEPEIVALGALIQPEVEEAAVMRIRIVNPKEFYLFVRRGTVHVAYDDEVESIGEGGAYRVLLSADDDTETKKAARGKKRKITLIAVGLGGGVAAGVAGYFAARGGRQVESPDRP